MLKAIKKGIKKRLGSSSKLQDEAAATSEGPSSVADSSAAERHVAAAAEVAAAATVAAVEGLSAPKLQITEPVPASEGLAQVQGEQQATGSQLEPESPAGATAGLPPRPPPRPQSPSVIQCQHQTGHTLDDAGCELGVDYELVAGPLELDGVLHDGMEPSGSHHHLEDQPASPGLDHQEGEVQGSTEQQQHPAWHDSAAPSAEGSGEGDSPTAEGAHKDVACAATGSSGHADGAAEGGAATTEDNITDALATMMFLTEGAGGADDCMSVVSDAISDEDLPDDISELSRALEALEGETLHGSSPASATGASSFGGRSGLDDQLAERLGISPDAGDPTAYSQQMAKLYNNLGLKLMERRQHEEALGLLRKAEAIVENEAMWGSHVQRRQRMAAITYNNLGCLLKRRNMPQLALQYLQKALALEELGGPVQNSSSTHLNISAAFSALKRPKEALAHAERAIILLQRHLWAHHLPFQEGLSVLVRQLALPGASHLLLGCANVLAMAYHNAAVEHEKLGHLREALVSFARADLIASKCLGHKAQITSSLHKALKAFQQRQARHLPTGATHAARKAPLLASSHQPKRGHSRTGSKTVGSSKSASSLTSKSMGSLAAAAANGKATLPLDKASKGLVAVRPPSASRLSTQL